MKTFKKSGFFVYLPVYFRIHWDYVLKIRPDIRYPAFGLAVRVYPVKLVFDASLVGIILYLNTGSSCCKIINGFP
jgi:hypothetical protein